MPIGGQEPQRGPQQSLSLESVCWFMGWRPLGFISLNNVSNPQLVGYLIKSPQAIINLPVQSKHWWLLLNKQFCFVLFLVISFKSISSHGEFLFVTNVFFYDQTQLVVTVLNEPYKGETQAETKWQNNNNNNNSIKQSQCKTLSFLECPL